MAVIKAVMKQTAIDDLNAIWNYTFTVWSEKQADQYYAGIKKTCLELGKNLRRGKSYAHILPGLYACKFKRHLIFYQFLDTSEIEVIRILHEQMDVAHRLIDMNQTK